MKVLKTFEKYADGTVLALVSPETIGKTVFEVTKEAPGFRTRDKKAYLQACTIPQGTKVELRACNVDEAYEVAYVEVVLYGEVRHVFVPLEYLELVSGNLGIDVTNESVQEEE